jgi:hypothetical protein
MHVEYECERQKEIDHLKDQDVGGLIILIEILEKC